MPSKEAIAKFTSKFSGIDSLIQLLLSSSICNFPICVQLVLCKFRIEHNGTMTGAMGLRKLEVFYQRFRAKADFRAMFQIIRADLCPEGTEDITGFCKLLLAKGEQFHLGGKETSLAFQLDFLSACIHSSDPAEFTKMRYKQWKEMTVENKFSDVFSHRLEHQEAPGDESESAEESESAK